MTNITTGYRTAISEITRTKGCFLENGMLPANLADTAIHLTPT
ncbi:hypothetical protein [Calothrix rhizosoleniae]|nr:hypothetical protein [Calothrix rhizosoleniae]